MTLFVECVLRTSFRLSRQQKCAYFYSLSNRSLSSDERTRLKYFEIPRLYPSPTDDLKDFNLVTHILEPWADKQPNHTALWLTDGITTTKLTYLSFLQQSQLLANSLTQGNLPPPKCGLVILPKIAPWWIINLAGSWCDMAISPGAAMLSERDILYRVKQANADAIFCDSNVMKKVDEVTSHVRWRVLVEETKAEELKHLRYYKDGWFSYHELVEKGASLKPIQRTHDGDSVAQLFFTSGTTGYPKMVAHTQRGYGLGQVIASRDWLSLQPSDLFWNISDLGWAKAAYSSLYAPLIAGSTAFVHQAPRFNAREVLDTLEQIPITHLCLPPTAMRSIVQEDLSSFKPKSLRRVTSAGEPLNPEISRTWAQYTGIEVREGYGQTETTLLCGTLNGVKVKPGSMGKPVEGYTIKILDEDLKELGPNEEGQLAISLHNGRPIGLFKGYPSKEQNEKAFVDNYFLTGDKAVIDDEDYVWYVGRGDDIIISAGYRIGPYEVESALIEHPAVTESAVVASPDYHRGHVVKAFIILKEEYKAKLKTEEDQNKLILEIQNFVKNTIAPYKYPRKIDFVETLPKTISGKIRRIELREQEEKQAQKPEI